MGFETGSMTFRMFLLKHRLPGDVVKGFASHAAPPLDAVKREAHVGWVTGRHLLDRHITDDTAYVGGYLRLTLVKVERKVPEALLRAECRMQELAEMKGAGEGGLKRDRRAAIRKEVAERLQPTMPPTLSAIPMVADSRAGIVYASATAEKQVDTFIRHFDEASGVELIPMTPEVASLKRQQVNARDLGPTSFSPEVEDEAAGGSLGQDFLTWLWFFSEARGGEVEVAREKWAVGIEGPLVFVLEGEGAHEAILRKGSPLVSAEAKVALLNGKKLKSARLVLARGESQWAVTLDADGFAFRGLKVPKEERLDPVSRFQERMLGVAAFREAFFALFDRFLAERRNEGSWRETRTAIHRWVSGRTAKR
jgi:hypothetical protein